MTATLLLCLWVVVVAGCSGTFSAKPEFHDSLDPSFAKDRIWYDGLVEKAVYDAQMTIYGHKRNFEAIYFTNKQQMDMSRLVKATADTEFAGEVFKLNYSAIVPTPNYDYRFLTTFFVNPTTQRVYKFASSSQEYCGTTYKQFLSDGKNGILQTYSYMPEEGSFVDKVKTRGNTIFYDALPLFVRYVPHAPGTKLDVLLVKGIISNRYEHPLIADATLSVVGDREIATSTGSIPCTLLRLSSAEAKIKEEFAISNDTRRLMVWRKQYDGCTFRLKAVNRVDYWTRD